MSDDAKRPASVRMQLKRVLRPAYVRYRELVPPRPPGPRALGQAPDTALRAVIGANRYGTYCVPSSGMTMPAARAVLAGRVYEPDTLALLTSAADGRDVVSAGTFFGDFLPALSHSIAGNPDARVWGFEPNPESFRCAEVTVALNDLRNVVVTNAALGAAPGDGLLFTREGNGRSLGGRSHLSGAGVDPELPGRQAGATTVALTSLDAFIPEDRDVGIVQLDLEGYELEAVRGAVGIIERCRPLLVLESVPVDRWFDELLATFDYEPVGKVHLNTVYRCRQQVRPDAAPGGLPGASAAGGGELLAVGATGAAVRA